MNKKNTWLLFFMIVFYSLTASAENRIITDNTNSPDSRISLGLTELEQVDFLIEMRQMLASIQGILEGIGEDNREQIIESARASGNRMARATPKSITQKLPSTFQEIGGPTHMMFEELVIRAETDDLETLVSFTGELMKQCLACHAMFKID